MRQVFLGLTAALVLQVGAVDDLSDFAWGAVVGILATLIVLIPLMQWRRM